MSKPVIEDITGITVVLGLAPIIVSGAWALALKLGPPSKAPIPSLPRNMRAQERRKRVTAKLIRPTFIFGLTVTVAGAFALIFVH